LGCSVWNYIVFSKKIVASYKTRLIIYNPINLAAVPDSSVEGIGEIFN